MMLMMMMMMVVVVWKGTREWGMQKCVARLMAVLYTPTHAHTCTDTHSGNQKK